MRRFIVGVVVGLMGLLATPSVVHAEADAQVRKMMRDVVIFEGNYRGTKTVIFWSTRGADAFIAQVSSLGKNTRFEYLPSMYRPARVVVETPTSVQCYQPSSKLLISADRPDSKREELRLLDIAFRNYDWEIEADALVAGVKTKILKATHRESGNVAQRLWVDARHHTVIRKENYNPRGEIYFSSHFTEIQFYPRLPEDHFKLSTPADIRLKSLPLANELTPSEIRSAVGFDPVFPPELPGGFMQVGLRQATFGGHTALYITYTDGIQTVTLVELPLLNAGGMNLPKDRTQLETLGQNIHFLSLAEGNFLQWRDQRLSYTLVGSLPRESMLAIFKAMKPPQVANTTPSPPRPKGIMDYFWKGIERIGRLFD